MENRPITAAQLAPRMMVMLPSFTHPRLSWVWTLDGAVNFAYWRHERGNVLTYDERVELEDADLEAMRATYAGADSRLDWLLRICMMTGYSMDAVEQITRGFFAAAERAAA